METKTWKNERAWCECVCVDAYVQYPVPSPLPILSSRRLDTARMPHNVLNEGTGLERFLLPCRDFSTQYKATDVTDLDITDITVLVIGLFKRKMLLRYVAAPDQQRAIVQPAKLFSFFFSKLNACFCRSFDSSPNICSIC